MRDCFTREVWESIANRRTVSVDDVMRIFPGKPRRAYCKALKNLERHGVVSLRRDEGGKKRGADGTYNPGIWDVVGQLPTKKAENNVDRRVSMTALVARAVEDRGMATVDDLLPMFPHVTRKQLIAAIKNAKHVGYLRIVSLGTMKGGPRHGNHPSTYAPGNKKPGKYPNQPPVERRVISSVFALAGESIFIPAGEGVRYSPLGEWNTAEDEEFAAA
jgi:hypothetical protein